MHLSLFGAELITGEEAGRLVQLEQRIERGLQTFVDVGNALLEIRDGRLYRSTHGTFEDYCRERWGMKRQRAYELMDAATIAGNLSEFSDIVPARESHVAALARLAPDEQRVAWQEAVETAPNGRVTAAHVERVAEQFRPAAMPLAAANHAVSADPSYDGDEWYTPAAFLDLVHAVMGGIDLDPATCEEAQATVQAHRYFTKEDDGLACEWNGRVFMNPPYSTPAIQKFTAKVLEEFDAGRVTEAIVLTNNSSETRWFQSLLARCVVCFPASRLQFWRAGADVFGARQGQAVFYLGPNRDRFAETFAAEGTVVVAI